MESINLELEFSVERLKRYLAENPDKAAELAVTYFEDFSVLAIEHKQLERDYEAVQIENMKLRSSKTHRSVCLPSFLQSNRGAL